MSKIYYFIQVEARITWTHSSNGQVTEFGNTPFRLLERRTLDCQFGKQYYKDKPRRSSRAMVQGTRKLGCPAHIEIKVYEVFPEYSISESVLTQNFKRALRMLKEDKMTRLKTALSMKDNVKSVKKYFVSLYPQVKRTIRHTLLVQLQVLHRK